MEPPPTPGPRGSGEPSSTPRQLTRYPSLASRVTLTPVVPKEGRRRAAFTPIPSLPAPSIPPSTDSGLQHTPPVPQEATPEASFDRTTHFCTTCGSLDVKVAMEGDIETSLSDDVVERVFRSLRSSHMTLGAFLAMVFASKSYGKKDTRQQITHFLRNQSTPNTRPADIVDLIYKHAKSVKHPSTGGRALSKTIYSNLPLYSTPPVRPTENLHGRDTASDSKKTDTADVDCGPTWAHNTLDEWALNVVLHNVDAEAAELAEKKFGYALKARGVDWSTLLAFSLSAVEMTIAQVAPVSWSILMTIATSPWRRDRLEAARAGNDSGVQADAETSDDDEDVETPLVSEARSKPKKGEGSGTARDPWLVATVTTLMLISMRNQYANIFQNLVGLLLFSCNANRAVFSILSRIGISSSYSATISRLHSLAEAVGDRLEVLGEAAYSHGVYWIIIYDNINKHHRPWFQDLGKTSEVKNGTAATLVMMDDYPEGAMDATEYHANCAKNERQQLTVERLIEDVNDQHIENVGTGTILRVLVKYIPGLACYEEDVEALYLTEYARHRMRAGRITQIETLGTTAIDEAKTVGNRDVIHDIVLNQFKLVKEKVGRMLIFIAGDQLSIDRLRKLKRYTEKDVNPFDRHIWVLPVIALWHLRYALLRCIYRLHWSPSVGTNVQGLAHDAAVLGRQINPKKCDYYPAHRLLQVSFESRVLYSARSLLRETASGASPCMPSIPAKSKMIEEVDHHFVSRGFRSTKAKRSEAKFLELKQFANRLYHRTLSAPALEHAYGRVPYEPLIYGARAQQSSIHDDDLRVVMDWNATRLDPAPDADTPSPETAESTPLEDGLLPEFGAPEDVGIAPNNVVRDSAGVPLDEEDWVPLTEITHALRTHPDESKGAKGDQMLVNNLLLMRDLFIHIELCSAVKEGDIGRVFEMIKLARFIFPAAGATNYTNEVLEQACHFFWEFPEKLKTAVLNNYLVNPTGLLKGWYEHDLLQEHHNFWIKRVFNSKNLNFDSGFLRSAVALNIRHFGNLRERLASMLGLRKRASGSAVLQTEADIQALAATLQDSDALAMHPGRTQPFSTADGIAVGIHKLSSGLLQSFLDRTAGESSTTM